MDDSPTMVVGNINLEISGWVEKQFVCTLYLVDLLGCLSAPHSVPYPHGIRLGWLSNLRLDSQVLTSQLSLKVIHFSPFTCKEVIHRDFENGLAHVAAVSEYCTPGCTFCTYDLDQIKSRNTASNLHRIYHLKEWVQIELIYWWIYFWSIDQEGISVVRFTVQKILVD